MGDLYHSTQAARACMHACMCACTFVPEKRGSVETDCGAQQGSLNSCDHQYQVMGMRQCPHLPSNLYN